MGRDQGEDFQLAVTLFCAKTRDHLAGTVKNRGTDVGLILELLTRAQQDFPLVVETQAPCGIFIAMSDDGNQGDAPGVCKVVAQ